MDTNINTIITETITEVFSRMGFEEEVLAVEPFQGVMSRFNVRLRGEAHVLIGEHGNNLIAIEHLLKHIIRQRHNEEYKFTLDINDYRIRRLEDLKQEVKVAAKKVRTFQQPVALRPMSSFERRIVHLLLAEYPDIMTESIGLDPERKVIIKPFV